MMKSRINFRLKPRNKTVKVSKASKARISKNKNACTYKTNGSIHVSKYMRCIANDTQLGSPKHIYEINDNAAFPFVVFDYGGGRASIYNNKFNELTNRGELNDKLMDVKYEQLFLGEKNDPYWRDCERATTFLCKRARENICSWAKAFSRFRLGTVTPFTGFIRRWAETMIPFHMRLATSMCIC